METKQYVYLVVKEVIGSNYENDVQIFGNYHNAQAEFDNLVKRASDDMKSDPEDYKALFHNENFALKDLDVSFDNGRHWGRCSRGEREDELFKNYFNYYDDCDDTTIYLVKKEIQ